MRQGRTEPPFSGKYLDHRERGRYRCAHCGQVLFESQHKFHSGCGWPSFLHGSDQVVVRPDPRVEDATEAICAHCQGHLGHLFDAEHYCINSASLNFEPLPLPSPQRFDGEPNQRDPRGATLLTYWPDLETLADLLGRGGSVGQERPEDGSTSVHRAAETGQLAALRLLWQADGATARERYDFLGRTPLACAAAGGHLQCLQFLLQQGALVDNYDPRRRGLSALDEAVRFGHREAARLLLEWGADPDLAIGPNPSPRELAAEHGWEIGGDS